MDRPAHRGDVITSARTWLGELSAEGRCGLILLVTIVALGTLVPALSPYDAAGVAI